MDETGNSSILLVARCLVAGLFMAQSGMVSGLLPVAIFIEILGGALLIIGFQMRYAALSLAGVCIVTALLFHANFVDRLQMFHFLKNIAIAGGLLALHVSGPGRMSFDGADESGG